MAEPTKRSRSIVQESQRLARPLAVTLSGVVLVSVGSAFRGLFAGSAVYVILVCIGERRDQREQLEFSVPRRHRLRFDCRAYGVDAGQASRQPSIQPSRDGIPGAAAGITSASAGMGGPPITAYEILTDWPHRSFVATAQPLFPVVGNVSFCAKPALLPAGAPAWAAWMWFALACSLPTGQRSGIYWPNGLRHRQSECSLRQSRWWELPLSCASDC